MTMYLDWIEPVAAGGFDPETDIAWHSLFWAEGTAFTALGLSDTDQVSTWPNETGESDATQATSANKPTYDASHADFNNQPVIDFTPGSSGQFLQTAAFSANPDYTDGVSIVIIVQLDATNNERYFLDGITSSQHVLRCIGGKWGLYAGED